MKNYLKKIISVILISVLVLFYPAGLFAEVIDLREEGSANGWSYAAAILGGFLSGYTLETSYGPGQMFVRSYLIPKLSDKLVWKMGVHDEMTHAIVSSALSSLVEVKLNYGEYATTAKEVAAHSWKSAIISAVSSGAKEWLTKTLYNKYKDKDKGFAQFVSFVSGLAFNLISPISLISSIVMSYFANKAPTAENADATIPDPNKVADGGQFTYDRKGIKYRQEEKKNEDGSTTIVLVPVEQLTKDKDGQYRYHPVDNKNSLGRILGALLTGRGGKPSKIHIRLPTEDKAVGSTPSTEGATPSTEGATPSTEGATPSDNKDTSNVAGLKELVPKAAGDASGKQEPARGPWGPWWVLKWLTDGYETASGKFAGWAGRTFGRKERKEADLSTALWLDEYVYENGWSTDPTIKQMLRALEQKASADDIEIEETEPDVDDQTKLSLVSSIVASYDANKAPANEAVETSEASDSRGISVDPRDATIASTITISPIPTTQLNKELPESPKEEIQAGLLFDTKLQYQDLPEKEKKNLIVRAADLAGDVTNKVVEDMKTAASQLPGKEHKYKRNIAVALIGFLGSIPKGIIKAGRKVVSGKEGLYSTKLQYKEAQQTYSFDWNKYFDESLAKNSK